MGAAIESEITAPIKVSRSLGLTVCGKTHASYQSLNQPRTQWVPHVRISVHGPKKPGEAVERSLLVE
jgi:hypothetical protein